MHELEERDDGCQLRFEYARTSANCFEAVQDFLGACERTGLGDREWHQLLLPGSDLMGKWTSPVLIVAGSSGSGSGS